MKLRGLLPNGRRFGQTNYLKGVSARSLSGKRPKGLSVNSLARKGVDTGKMNVAIKLRPFGPGLR